MSIVDEADGEDAGITIKVSLKFRAYPSKFCYCAFTFIFFLRILEIMFLYHKTHLLHFDV